MKINKQENLRKLKKFLRIFGKNYEPEIYNYIKREFLNYRHNKTSYILLQIYALFNMLEDSENHYLQFAKMVGQKYGYDKNILEVGCGYLPMFAKYYNKLQLENNKVSKLTVYDPDIVVNKAKNIKLCKETFTPLTNIDDYDLLVGILPCEATKTIIDKAIECNKEFFIAMCGCTHFSDEQIPWGPLGPIISYDYWVDDVYELAGLQQFYGYDVNKECASFDFPYPIISSKKILKK